MTLCIGAVCEQDDSPRIILCFAGGEVSGKLKWLDAEHRWAALVVDSGGRGTQLVDTLRRHFKDKISIPDAEIYTFLEAGLALHKIRLADEFFKMNYAVTYDEILSNGLPGAKKSFPEKFVEEKLAGLESLPLNAQLIVAGFTEEKTPALFVMNEDQYSSNPVPIRRDENFVAIGSGAPSALMSMYRRKHIGTEMPIMRACYNVFEAMVLSEEISPGVGKEDMSIDVLSPDGPPASLNDAGYSYVSRRYDDDFGPRPIEKRHKFTFSEKYMEPLAEGSV